MAKLETLHRLQGRIRAGHTTRELRVRQGDTAIVFTLPDGAAVEVDLAASADGGLVVRSHSVGLRAKVDGSSVVVRPEGGGA